MPSAEKIRGNDTCSIMKFEGLPGKSKQIVEEAPKKKNLDSSIKASFQTSILIKEEN